MQRSRGFVLAYLGRTADPGEILVPSLELAALHHAFFLIFASGGLPGGSGWSSSWPVLMRASTRFSGDVLGGC
jgi:hypothetical protein